MGKKIAGAVFITFLTCGLITRAFAQGVLPAPVARVEVVKDTYFGETVSDPYRWMENSKDPDWLPFPKGQNNHTRAVIDALPGRAALLKRIEHLSGEAVATSRVQRAGGLTFVQQRPLGADNFKLFVRRGLNGSDRVLVDPTAMSSASSHVSLDWWQASPDGKYVAYGLSNDGSEDSRLHVLTVADGKNLPETIPNTEVANPQWLENASGFFYTQLTGAVGTPERYLDAQARFHRLGSDPESDPILMKRDLVAGVAYDKIQIPTILTAPGSRYAILQLADIRPEGRWFIAPLSDVIAGKAKWVSFADFNDEVTDLQLDGNDLYLLVNKGSPRGRIVKTSAATPSLTTGTVVVPQHARLVIESTARARDGIYLKIMDGGISRLQRLSRDGKVVENGYGEEPEWGAIADPAGYKALKMIDSYQSVKDGTAYPAVLLTTGVTDPRVAPFHAAKMTARLQAATTSGKPILLRVDYDAGHGIGSTRAQKDREAADTYAFLLWQLTEPSGAVSKQETKKND